MITPGRHRPLVQDAWNESAVRVAIEEIAADATAHFHPDTFWPAHPSDDGVGDGDPSFYKGAAGVIWALAAIMHDVTRFRTCVERVSGSNPTRWIGVVPLAVQRV